MLLTNIMNQEWFTGLLATVALAVGTGLSTLIGLLFKKLGDNLATKTKNEKVKQALDLINKLIQDAVLTVQQTFVDDLKKEGKFNAETQKQALEKALEMIKANITTEAEELLNEIYGDVTKWLTIQVEAFIATLKK